MTKLASSGIVMLLLQLRTSRQGKVAVTNTDPVPGSCETHPDRVTATGSGLPNFRPAKIAHKILDDLQAGTLSPPE